MMNVIFGAIRCIIGGVCIFHGVKQLREGAKEIEEDKLLKDEEPNPQNKDESGLPDKI